MKYVIIIGDGMSDEPLIELGGKTPLAYADTPLLDRLAQTSRLGMAQMIPDGMSPGSDTANLAVLGFDPRQYYSGRSPLEALSIGAAMEENDIAIRTNLVTLSEEKELSFAERCLIDHSAGDIATADAAVLLEAARSVITDEACALYTGTGYRHCLLCRDGNSFDTSSLTPPHDILGQVVGSYLPSDKALLAMMEESYQILSAHPLNTERREQGKRPANSLWFWGAGSKPKLLSFEEKTGKKAIMISAVDLLKGIAIATGMSVAQVAGADGSINTNFAGKVEAARKALLEDGCDLAYIHIEAPDEMSHQGDLQGKILAIEYLEKKVIAPIYDALVASGEAFRLLVLPDHPTPLRLRTHTGESVPFLLYDSTVTFHSASHYDEVSCWESGDYLAEGYKLIDEFLT
jgi:2,3-bisphosphoglycerate-independent phosphoglycerate mutase